MQESRARLPLHSVGTSAKRALPLLLDTILVAVLAALVLSRQGATLTSAFTSACLSVAVLVLLSSLFGRRFGVSLASLSGLLLIVAAQPTPVGDSLSCQLALCLLATLVLLVLELGPVRGVLSRGVPASLRVSASVSLAVMCSLAVLSLCGVAAWADDGSLSLVGIFDPVFVDAAVSVLATAVLHVSGVPFAGLLGLAIAAFAGIPLGLSQAPAGLMTTPDLTLATEASSEIMSGLPRLLARIATPEGLGLAFALPLCLVFLSDSGNAPEGERRPVSPLLALGSAVTLLAGVPGLFGHAAAGETKTPARSSEGVIAAFLLLVLCVLSPLVACVPISAACGPLLSVALSPLGKLAAVKWEDPSESLPLATMVFLSFATRSLPMSLAAGVLVRCAVDLGSGHGRSLGLVIASLAVVSVAYLFAISGF